jgi:ribonuclease Z
MEFTLLGTGSDFPRPDRPLTAGVLRMDSALYLLDCGEGTQQRWAEARLNLAGLRVVALTHMHPAQLLGLPGLLARRGQIPEAGPLTIVAPEGTDEVLVPLLLGLGVRLSYELRFVALSGPAPGKKQPLPVAYRDEHLELRWLPVDHTVPCVGFRSVEHPRPGKFSPQAARARGVAPGPDFGALQGGRAVTAPDGSVVQPDEVVGPPRPGRELAWIADAASCPALYRLLRDVDLAVLGGGHLPEHEALATSNKQLTLRDAARICGRSKVQRALLTQLSPRLTPERLEEADALAAEHGEGYRCGRDGERLVIPGRG